MENKNTGHRSTGHRSTGDRSTGNGSTGDRSTGNWSTGDRSTGDCSTGHRSTGHWSTGHRSTGNWSISNYSTGHFSTIDYSGYGAFNKPCTKEEWDNAEKPSFFYFDLTAWVSENQMAAHEKEDHPEYKTIEGYLKVYDYQEAWKIAWDNATDEDKELLFKLPNFDVEVFKEISGIDVNAKQTKTITLDGKDIEISLESFNVLKKSLID